MSAGPDTDNDRWVSTALARAVRSLLRPLVRLLLEKQISYPFVSNLLKALYVEVAENDLAIPGRRGTDSRVSLLTGIHRKEVKRLREDLRRHDGIPNLLTVGALLVSRWIGDQAFVDEEGRPVPLPRRAPAPSPSFEALVASISTDIPPRSILDEWIRLGVVEVDESGLIRLAAESFVPEQGFDEKTHFFGRNIRDHIATGAHNLLDAGPAFFDRSVYYDNLSKESANKLADIAREEGSALIRRMNSHALQMQREDEGSKRATHRMTFGAYFFAEDELEASGAEKDESDES